MANAEAKVCADAIQALNGVTDRTSLPIFSLITTPVSVVRLTSTTVIFTMPLAR
jgi:hypothetical protein